MRLNFNLIFPSLIILIIISFGTGYIFWSSANPRESCASCHEISPSVESSLTSAHRNIECTECHGTAFSNGFHSLQEKTNMFFNHIVKKPLNDEIRLTEKQIIEIIHKCKNCHQTQYADWRAGGHSVTYEQIFLNETHNKMEQLYWDCFRCHGMFYEGTIYDLMEPIDNKGPWRLIDPDQAELPTIPCSACHEIHSENTIRQPARQYSEPKNIFYEREERNIPYGLYIRADKLYLRADYFTIPEISHNDKKIKLPTEYDYLLCVQCHSPNFKHDAGSEDDRTPIGVHEGLTCNSCHKPHSNNARNSCGNCHPAISNCGLDVTKMNTSYLSIDSPNNIHFVACIDCQPEQNNKVMISMKLGK